jgi:hypothetical protein
VFISLTLIRFIITITKAFFTAAGTNQKPTNMKKVFLFLLTGLLNYSLQAQQTIEFSYWKYSNGLNSKPRKMSSFLEKYNADNLLIERTAGAYNDSLYDRTVYTYNTKKQKIAEEDYVLTHKPVRKKNYEYNDSGLLQIMHWKGRNKIGDSIIWREQYFYDAEGRLIKMVETSGDHYPAETHLYEYENKGDKKIMTEAVSTEGRKKIRKKITTYNNKGLIIKLTQKGFNSMLSYPDEVIYEYEYDAEGNWMKRKVLERISKISPWIWTGEYRRKKLQ